jgi:arylformamidase
VIENLCNLSALPTNGFRFFAVPLGTTDQATVPVRAFAELQPL